MKTHFECNTVMEKNNFISKMLGGLFVIGFGVLILLNQIGMNIPNVFTSWEMVLILMGIVSIVKHNFKKMFGYVLIVVGGIFMINDFYPYTVETRFIWPVLIIIFGISLFFKAMTSQKKKPSYTIIKDNVEETKNSEDFIESTAFFGGVNKNIVSKAFEGGKVTSFFGGTQINLSHADIEGPVNLDISCIFGGIELIVPSHWKIQTELTTVFGGVDDKRNVGLIDENSGKMIILKGNVFFGGVEISSYA